MRYVAPESGRLPIDVEENHDGVIDSIMEEVIADTREFHELPEPLQQTLLQAVRKAAVLGVDEGAEGVGLDFTAEKKDVILDAVVDKAGVSIDSPYVTFHDVRRTARMAIQLTLEAVATGDIYNVGDK